MEHRACDAATAGQTITTFGFSLLKALGNESSFVSPTSAYFALSLALAASGVASSTHRELVRALLPQLRPGDDAGTAERELYAQLQQLMGQLLETPATADGCTVLLANALWSSKVQVKADYAAAMLRTFQAHAQSGASAADINAWAARVTQGLIPELLPPSTPFDLVLTNVLYFKGAWSYSFERSATQQRPFTNHLGAQKQVAMMRRVFGPADKGVLLARVPGSFQGVRLPYQGGAFSALALLPDPSTTADALLQHLLPSGVAASLLASAAVGLWHPTGSLALSLPRFSLRSRSSLVATLQQLGVSAAFSSIADFSRALSEAVEVSDIIHEVVVDVDEAGTEAAAATAVTMIRFALMPPEMVFDRPFVFCVLHDASSTALVLGTVCDPGGGAEQPLV